MSNDTVADRSRIKIECDHVDVMAARDQTTSELTRPVLGATTRRIEPFHDDTDLHRR